jgi:hypothetical protein
MKSQHSPPQLMDSPQKPQKLLLNFHSLQFPDLSNQQRPINEIEFTTSPFHSQPINKGVSDVSLSFPSQSTERAKKNFFSVLPSGSSLVRSLQLVVFFLISLKLIKG